jgi:hypothetical protein
MHFQKFKSISWPDTSHDGAYEVASHTGSLRDPVDLRSIDIQQLDGVYTRLFWVANKVFLFATTSHVLEANILTASICISVMGSQKLGSPSQLERAQPIDPSFIYENAVVP